MKKVLFDEQARQDLSSQHHHHHYGKYYTNTTTRHRSLETFSQHELTQHILLKHVLRFSSLWMRSNITFCNKGWHVQNICKKRHALIKKFSYLVCHTHACRNPCQHDPWILEFRFSKRIMCWCFMLMHCVEPLSAKLSKVSNQEFAAIIATICDLAKKILLLWIFH